MAQQFNDDSRLRDSTFPNQKAENISANIPDGFHKCPRCGVWVSNERSVLLGIDECIKCSPQKRPPIGVWDYPEGFHERNEGVGGLMIVD